MRRSVVSKTLRYRARPSAICLTARSGELKANPKQRLDLRRFLYECIRLTEPSPGVVRILKQVTLRAPGTPVCRIAQNTFVPNLGRRYLETFRIMTR